MITKVSDNKKIYKNTMFLYIRMMITMVISLYTSRVILQVLGVNDYGLYQSVGGIVGFLSFLNSALSTGTSRFIAFGLGEGNVEKLKKIFSTTLTGHIILALIIILFAETLGLWFLHNKLIIPADRMLAAEWVFHLSVITVFFTLSQVPYNACIIAHEKMHVFAYVSIVDAVCKLLIVYTLLIGETDKLILYAISHCTLQLLILFFYRVYCNGHFAEVHFQVGVDRPILKEIVGFSGWSLFANSAIALNNQGILLLINMFFTPAIVAARSISIQVEMTAYHFVTNFQTASVPQIVKRYAQKDYIGSKALLLNMTRFSFFLMLLMAMPIFFSAEQLLHVWLGIVPPYTVVFLKIIIIQSLFQVFDTSFYKALYAKGQLKENALLSPMCLFINFVVVYFMFNHGFSPIALSWSTAICYAIIAFVVKPILLVKIVSFNWSDIWTVIWSCLRVVLLSFPLPLFVNLYLNSIELSHFISFLVIVSVSMSSVAIVVWFFGLTADIRKKMLFAVKEKLGRK